MDTNYLSQIEFAVESGISKAQGKPPAVVSVLAGLRQRPFPWWEQMAEKAGVLASPGGPYRSLTDALTHGYSVTPVTVVHAVAGFIFKGGR